MHDPHNIKFPRNGRYSLVPDIVSIALCQEISKVKIAWLCLIKVLNYSVIKLKMKFVLTFQRKYMDVQNPIEKA